MLHDFGQDRKDKHSRDAIQRSDPFRECIYRLEAEQLCIFVSGTVYGDRAHDSVETAADRFGDDENRMEVLQLRLEGRCEYDE